MVNCGENSTPSNINLISNRIGGNSRVSEDGKNEFKYDCFEIERRKELNGRLRIQIYSKKILIKIFNPSD